MEDSVKHVEIDTFFWCFVFGFREYIVFMLCR